MNSKVSVILTSYNKARYVRQAIASVLAQTYQDYELLIVDDHSTDGSYEIASSLLFDKVYLIKSDLPRSATGINRYAHNINLAFARSQGEYITYLCDDDTYLPWRLDLMVKVLDFDQKANVVYGTQQLLWEQEDGSLKLGGLREAKEVRYDARMHVDHSSVMHRRHCFTDVGGWDEAAPMRYGDSYFWKRLTDAGHYFHPIDYLMDTHRFNSLSVTHAIEKGMTA